MKPITPFCLGVALAIAHMNPAYPGTTLDIPPKSQQTPEWCWVTAGEMVFTYFGVANINPRGNFQCGIVALISPACNIDCGNCALVAAGSLNTIGNMLSQYSLFASTHTPISARLSADATPTALSMDDVRAEIDSRRPIIIGISPSGHPPLRGSEHVALIVGYDENANVIVNDPYPFNAALRTPYVSAGGDEIAPGQFSISRNQLVKQLLWRETVYHINCIGADCAQASARANVSSVSNLDPGDEAVSKRDAGAVVSSEALKGGLGERKYLGKRGPSGHVHDVFEFKNVTNTEIVVLQCYAGDRGRDCKRTGAFGPGATVSRFADAFDGSGDVNATDVVLFGCKALDSGCIRDVEKSYKDGQDLSEFAVILRKNGQLCDSDDSCGGTYLAPTKPSQTTVTNSATNRLTQLKELRDKGLISAEEYQAKRKAILDTL